MGRRKERGDDVGKEGEDPKTKVGGDREPQGQQRNFSSDSVSHSRSQLAFTIVVPGCGAAMRPSSQPSQGRLIALPAQLLRATAAVDARGGLVLSVPLPVQPLQPTTSEDLPITPAFR